jgi:hypothetical protein
MSTFVLQHPAWFGGWSWKKVVPLLRVRGHDVFHPHADGKRARPCRWADLLGAGLDRLVAPQIDFRPPAVADRPPDLAAVGRDNVPAALGGLST